LTVIANPALVYWHFGQTKSNLIESNIVIKPEGFPKNKGIAKKTELI